MIRNPLILFATDIYLPRWLVQLRNDSANWTQRVLMGVWWRESARGKFVGAGRNLCYL
ncbi:hypothetical protein EMIT0P100_30039 [Pseudomonas sp. IT-P100]